MMPRARDRYFSFVLVIHNSRIAVSRCRVTVLCRGLLCRPTKTRTWRAGCPAFLLYLSVTPESGVGWCGSLAWTQCLLARTCLVFGAQVLWALKPHIDKNYSRNFDLMGCVGAIIEYDKFAEPPKRVLLGDRGGILFFWDFRELFYA